MFYHNSRVRAADVRDGLSNTLFVGERNSELDFSTWVGVVHGVKHAIPRIVGSVEEPPRPRQKEFEYFSSHHPSGAIFLFGDGRVRLIHSEVDPVTFRALGTRKGKEMINADNM